MWPWKKIVQFNCLSQSLVDGFDLSECGGNNMEERRHITGWEEGRRDLTMFRQLIARLEMYVNFNEKYY